MKNIENMEVSELFNFIITEYNSYDSDKEELSEIISQNISKDLDTSSEVFIDLNSKRIYIYCYLYPVEVLEKLNDDSNNHIKNNIENDLGFEIKVFYFYGKDISMDTYNRMIKINNYVNDILVSMIKKNITEKNIITYSEYELKKELDRKIRKRFKYLGYIYISRTDKRISIEYDPVTYYKYNCINVSSISFTRDKENEIVNHYDLDCGFKLKLSFKYYMYLTLEGYKDIAEFTEYILENFNKGF